VAKDMDGNVIKPNDNVGFKDGVEQYGKVVRITGDMVNIKCWDSVEGRYYDRNLQARRVWVEN
jgi:hypothetical protein